MLGSHIIAIKSPWGSQRFLHAKAFPEGESYPTSGTESSISNNSFRITGATSLSPRIVFQAATKLFLMSISRDTQSVNGSLTKIVSSRSGLVDKSATGASMSSSICRIYFIAFPGSSDQERAPRVLSDHPSKVL